MFKHFLTYSILLKWLTLVFEQFVYNTTYLRLESIYFDIVQHLAMENLSLCTLLGHCDCFLRFHSRLNIKTCKYERFLGAALQALILQKSFSFFACLFYPNIASFSGFFSSQKQKQKDFNLCSNLSSLFVNLETHVFEFIYFFQC